MKYKIFIIISLMLIFFGCIPNNYYIEKNNGDQKIKGTYIANYFIDAFNVKNELAKTYLVIDENESLIVDTEFSDVEFKIRKYRVLPSDDIRLFNIFGEKWINVLTLYSNGRYLCEIYYNDVDNLVLNYRNNYYAMNKTEEYANFSYKNIVNYLRNHYTNQRISIIAPTGVFVTFKNSSDKESFYQTYYIYREHNICKIYKVSGIYYPENNMYKKIIFTKDYVGGILNIFPKIISSDNLTDLSNMDEDINKFENLSPYKIKRAELIYFNNKVMSLKLMNTDNISKKIDLNYKLQSINSNQLENIRLENFDISNFINSRLKFEISPNNDYFFNNDSLTIARSKGYWKLNLVLKSNIKNININISDLINLNSMIDENSSFNIYEINNFFPNVQDFFAKNTRNLAIIKLNNYYKIALFNFEGLKLEEEINLGLNNAEIISTSWVYNFAAKKHLSNIQNTSNWIQVK